MSSTSKPMRNLSVPGIYRAPDHNDRAPGIYPVPDAPAEEPTAEQCEEPLDEPAELPEAVAVVKGAAVVEDEQDLDEVAEGEPDNDQGDEDDALPPAAKRPRSGTPEQ